MQVSDYGVSRQRTLFVLPEYWWLILETGSTPPEKKTDCAGAASAAFLLLKIVTTAELSQLDSTQNDKRSLCRQLVHKKLILLTFRLDALILLKAMKLDWRESALYIGFLD